MDNRIRINSEVLRVLREMYPEASSYSAIVNTVLMNHFVISPRQTPVPMYEAAKVLNPPAVSTEADDAFDNLFAGWDDE